jgi:hypothetical protein
MKNHIITGILAICYSLSASAGTITAISNGNWIASSTWDVGRAPQDNDLVIIPATKQVSFTGSPYPKNTPSSRPTMNIKIYGILDFSTAGNDKLYLDAGSTIEIFTDGKIQTSTASMEIIAIYTGSTDNTVWTGSPAILDGPSNATATTSGFANGILPVNLKSFTIKKDNKGFATLSWTTSAEMNSLRFEIERSSGETVNWQFAGNVEASGSSSTDQQYHFSIPLNAGENRFRLKEVDIDGKFTYSNVVGIKYNDDTGIEVNYNQSTHQLSLRVGENSQFKIHIFDESGHALYSGSVTTSIVFKPSTAGVYFVNVVNRKSHFARKIMVY